MTVKRTTRWAGAATIAAASALTLGATASPVLADTTELIEPPDSFTSAFVVAATPENVIGTDGQPSGGVPGAEGVFQFLINSDEEIICWDIEVTGLTTGYQSLARTATHIHETVAGQNGPPRLSFPDPAPADSTDPEAVRRSSGCSEGPFTTGLNPGPPQAEAPPGDPNDSGIGFELSEIEADLEAEAFSADTHTTNAVPGAVRGQLVFSQELLDAANADDAPAPGDDTDEERPTPIGGVRTGEGGSASTLPVGLLAAFTVGGAGLAGAAVLRRRQSA